MKFKILSIILLLAALQTAFAQKEVPTTWETSVSRSDVKVGETVDLIFKAKIIDGWYLYSSDFDPDLGPVVASFTFTENDSYQLSGDIKPIGTKSKEDNLIWMGTYTYFLGKAEFRQTVKILKENPVIQTKLYAQACNDESGKCVPVIQQFSFNQIKVSAASEKKAPEQNTPADKGKNEQPKNPDKKNTTGMRPVRETTPDKTPAPYTSASLEQLKAEKQKLLKPSPQGEDLVIKELNDFVKKYGAN